MDLSVIDLNAPLAEQAATMASACESTGFFRIPLSSVDASAANQAWDDAQSFFALREAQKRMVEFPNPGYPYGYSPFGFESLAKSVDSATQTPPDLKESLSVGPDCASPHSQPKGTSSTDWIRSPSLWPDDPPRLQASWTGYYRALAGVCEHLMSVMAVALELPADYFESMIDDPITSMRAIHYPTLGTVPTDGALRAGAHSDYGTLTILRTDDVPGLEIENADGSWLGVEPMADTFVVNLGDSIAQWTNDRWRSTNHRVTPTDPRGRQSFAFFHMTNWDATIECLPTCLEDGEAPRHEPVQAGPWLMEKFQATVT